MCCEVAVGVATLGRIRGARWLAVLEEDEPDGGRDGVERSGTEPIGHLTALRRRKRFFGLQPQNDKRAPAGL